MNPYNLSVLFFGFCNFFIGLLIFLKRNDEVGKRYLIFSIAVGVWGFFLSLLINQDFSYENALLSARLCNFSAVFIPVTWLHLVLSLVNRVQKYKKILFFLYILAFLIDLFAFTPWFIPNLKPAVGFVHYTRTGFIFHIFVFQFFTVVPFAFRELLLKIQQTKKEEKLQLAGFFVATLLGFIGGSLTFLPAYDIMFPQHTLFLLPIYPFMMAYFMIRHRLFDIDQIAEQFQREKLATIGLLVASVNHEIRNPLYAARSVLESYEEIGKEPKEITKKAVSQINRALDVITKLNRFAKPAVSTGPDQKASVCEALETVFDLVSYEFQLDKIQIVNQIDRSFPSIQADQRQLEEILFNLIVNACHAMSGKGDRQEVLSGSFSVLTLRSTIHDTRVTIEISDTGTGISPEQTKHLFEPFYTTKGEKGTGLGLYITKQLVERNGGKISVKSEEGKGTSFVLEFRTV